MTELMSANEKVRDHKSDPLLKITDDLERDVERYWNLNSSEPADVFWHHVTLVYFGRRQDTDQQASTRNRSI